MPTNKPRKMRGPSRPVDPRYAPGRPTRKGPDTFGFVLIGVSTAFVLILLLVLAAQGNGTSTTTASDTPVSSQPTQSANAFATQTASLPRIEPQDAKTLTGAKFVDARDVSKYSVEHITGAISVPYSSTAALLAQVPKTGDVIVYCQWPADEESASLALTLHDSGYTNVKILHGGLDAWKNAGGATGK